MRWVATCPARRTKTKRSTRSWLVVPGWLQPVHPVIFRCGERRAKHVQRKQRAGARIGSESANKVTGRSYSLVGEDRISRRPQRAENGWRGRLGQDSLENGCDERQWLHSR